MDKVEGKKVLVISSEIEMAELVKTVLVRERNDKVVTSVGGHQGLLAATRDHPDLIFLEIMMLDLDGWEVLKRLRENEALNKVPVLLTSVTMSEIGHSYIQRIEAVGVIFWPATPQEILAARDAMLQGATHYPEPTDYYPKPKGCLASLVTLVRSILQGRSSE